MKSWKTTLAGLLLAAATLFGSGKAITTGNALQAIGAVLVGLVAKDHDVSGDPPHTVDN